MYMLAAACLTCALWQFNDLIVCKDKHYNLYASVIKRCGYTKV